ncbi:hypothetical protein BGZ96_012540 [Linnemannia gamsii]|uniref:F-box domain-containing protein n=1 Tax=Linnemannia gamsii TaxID=64522 RepID=A0ABQ7JQ78_9FUNG|nr:hypothetical protein BGZ96_012540 [Linnemannia gamsii]
MAPTTTTTRLLDLPEIRTRIAGFLTIQECLICMRVSRSWLMDFAGQVWSTFDFDEAESFSKIPPDVVSKYGHLIHRVLNVHKEEHIMALQHPNIVSLKAMVFLATHNKLSLILFHDLLGHHRKSLTALRASGEMVASGTLEEQVKSGAYLTLDAIRPSCSLTRLFLDKVCITRKAFSSILQSSPSLQFLKLEDVVLLAYNPMLEHFRHTGLTTLDAARPQIWGDSEDLLLDSQSLLVHFPSLKDWGIQKSVAGLSPEMLKKLKGGLLLDCPRLKSVRFCMTESDSIASYLDNVFHELESCTFVYASLNRTVLLSLLEHQASLTSIFLTPTDTSVGPSTPDELVYSKKIIGLLLKSCGSLQVLSVEGHQMDVSFLEDETIACMDLQELRVRFYGLDTAALVDGCLEAMLTRQKPDAGIVQGQNKNGQLVSERVRYQLMRFKKLKTVWLGTRAYYLPTH